MAPLGPSRADSLARWTPSATFPGRARKDVGKGGVWQGTTDQEFGEHFAQFGRASSRLRGRSQLGPRAHLDPQFLTEKDAGLLHQRTAEQRLQNTKRRYLSGEDELWRHDKKRQQLDDPGKVRLLDPRGPTFSEALLAIYKKSDGVDKKKKRPLRWRQDVMA